MIWPWAKEHLGPPGAGRGREGPPLDLWREPGPADTSVLDFQPPDCERIYFCRLNPPVCGHLLWPPQDTQQPLPRDPLMSPCFRPSLLPLSARPPAHPRL